MFIKQMQSIKFHQEDKIYDVHMPLCIQEKLCVIQILFSKHSIGLAYLAFSFSLFEVILTRWLDGFG